VKPDKTSVPQVLADTVGSAPTPPMDMYVPACRVTVVPTVNLRATVATLILARMADLALAL